MVLCESLKKKSGAFVLLSAKKQLILDVIHKLECKKITSREALLLLSISERTLRRYVKNYRKTGLLFLKHGNQGKTPTNRVSVELKERVQKLVKEQYYDFNMTHCLEKLEIYHGIKIKRETFRKWCHEANCVKRPKKRRAIVRMRRDRMERPGLLLQMDGSFHRWYGNEKSCLIAIIDDATSEILYAQFFPQESTVSCMSASMAIVRDRSVFNILYVDRAGVYGGIKRTGFSQVERALKELDSQVIYAHSPEAKGRIERLFSTLQDRLIPELRILGIITMTDANRYLQETHLQSHNKKFSVQAESPFSEFRSVDAKVDLNQIFCIREFRSISRDHTFSLNAKRYRLIGPIKHSLYRQKVEIRTYLDGTWKAFVRGNETLVSKVKLVRAAA